MILYIEHMDGASGSHPETCALAATHDHERKSSVRPLSLACGTRIDGQKSLESTGGRPGTSSRGETPTSLESVPYQSAIEIRPLCRVPRTLGGRYL